LRKFSQHRLRLAGVLCLALTILPAAGDSSARVEKIGHKLICMCGCEQVLLECNHYGCPYLTPESAELTAAVDRGDSESGILQSFVAKYGVTVLAAPTTTGFDRIAWIMPYVALLIGVGSVVLVVRNWRGHPTPAQAVGTGTKGTPDLDRFREQARRETDL
jgi:cytochrome c-type biogenesis protein CcmH/NrfF